MEIQLVPGTPLVHTPLDAPPVQSKVKPTVEQFIQKQIQKLKSDLNYSLFRKPFALQSTHVLYFKRSFTRIELKLNLADALTLATHLLFKTVEETSVHFLCNFRNSATNGNKNYVDCKYSEKLGLQYGEHQKQVAEKKTSQTC